MDEAAIERFREYIRIPSVHPDANYEGCIDFLKQQAKELDLPVEVFNFVPGKPVAIITWKGTNPTLPAIMLNSHMDVVPAEEDKWNYKPFSADIDEEGNIYGRGTQDMKSVGIQYLEAVRRLQKDDVRLKRTIYITFVPDEEIGGADGMRELVKSESFKAMNLGFVLDESMGNKGEGFFAFYGEKAIWQFHIHCPGTPGHGSSLQGDTAAAKVQYIINKMLNFRECQVAKVGTDPIGITKVISINLTQLKGGVQSNVIPSEFTAVFDCRLPVTTDHEEWENTLNEWCKEAGDDVWIEYELKQPPVPITKIDDSNPYWVAFKEVTENEMGLQLLPIICPGSTDAKYTRRAGIPSIGFSPLNNTERLLHSHNEYLNVKVFLKGIEIYYNVIRKLGNLE